MKVLVTGASGSIGGYTLRELARCGHDATNFARSEAKGPHRSISGDIMDPESLIDAAHGFDSIVHLAGIPGPGRAPTNELISVNVIGTVNVLEAAVKSGIERVVYASSAAACGFSFQTRKLTPKFLPIDETHPDEPHDDYGLSKLMAETACKRYSDAFGISTIALRLNHNWYTDSTGAGIAVRSSWAKGLTVPQLWATRYLPKITGPYEADRAGSSPTALDLLWSFTDARDAARAIRLGVECESVDSELLYINGWDTCSVEPTADLLRRYYPELETDWIDRPHASLVSADRAQHVLGYQASHTWRNSDFWDWAVSEGALTAEQIEMAAEPEPPDDRHVTS